MNYDAKIFLESLFGIQVCEELPPKWAEEYEERAGILEFDGCLPREQAEMQARREMLVRKKS